MQSWIRAVSGYSGVLGLGLLFRVAVAQYGFTPNPHLYSETADPAADIVKAEMAARPGHKRILLEFGGNWCGDCQVLDYYEHHGANAALLSRYYELVRVDIGHMDHNVATAEKYHVPITKGVPALAILDDHGKLLFAEQPKEFERPSPETVQALLERWKP